MRHSLSLTERNLSDYDIAICKAFGWLVQSHLSGDMFATIPDGFSAFVTNEFPTSYFLRARAKALTGIEPIRYDCCVNSCVCYAGHYKPLDKCPECKEPRFSGHNSHGNPCPRRQFLYIPLIPRLFTFLQSIHMAELMQYRSSHIHTCQGLGYLLTKTAAALMISLT